MQLDQFYTSPEVAEKCFHRIAERYNLEIAMLVEPSAGTGSFFNLMPSGSIGIDLEPKCLGVQEGDFMDFTIQSHAPVYVVGNPPFGKNASLAVSFFNHAATFAQVIAFIVPKTFRKVSVQNRLDLSFHQVDESDIPTLAFIADGEPYDVPCTFQVWEKRDPARVKVVTETRHPDFEFVSQEKADFAIQRVGVRAGTMKRDNVGELSQQSHYFIKSSRDVMDKLEQIDYTEVKYNTAGNPSISKNEMIQLYKRI